LATTVGQKKEEYYGEKKRSTPLTYPIRTQKNTVEEEKFEVPVHSIL
jgi:hypothetical protein